MDTCKIDLINHFEFLENLCLLSLARSSFCENKPMHEHRTSALSMKKSIFISSIYNKNYSCGMSLQPFSLVIFFSQLFPQYPLLHSQSYRLTSSTHLPLIQGFELHSSILTSQCGPENPAWHLQ